MLNPTAERSTVDVGPQPMGADLLASRAQPLRVLFATDGSDASAAAADWLQLLPLPAGSALRVVTILEAHGFQTPESLKGAEMEWGHRILGKAEDQLAREGVRMTHGIIRGAPTLEILGAADAFDATLVVVGSHGRTGFERFLLGSVAENVAKHARCPVLVARKPQNRLRQVLLAVDGSAHCEHAIAFCAAFPLPADTGISVCHVYHRYYPASEVAYAPEFASTLEEVWKQQQDEAEQLVARINLRLEQSRKKISSKIRTGDPAAELLDLQKQQEADLIIAGTRGISAVEAIVMGSVADRVLRHADCSVLLVP